jgi:hypothetical protein
MKNQIQKIKKPSPISILDLDNEDRDYEVVRMEGKYKDIATYFNPHDIYEEWRDVELDKRLSYSGREEWYVKIDRNNPILKEIKEKTVDRMIKRIARFNKTRVHIIRELRKHIKDIFVLENEVITFGIEVALSIGPNTILWIEGNKLILSNDEKEIEIDESQPLEKIIEIILSNIK